MENTPPPVPENQPPAITSSPTTDNSLAVVMHLLGFAWFVFPFYGNVLGPLVLWLIKRSDSPLLDRVGKEVLNFQISFSIYISLAIAVGTVLLIFLIGILFYFLAAAVWVAWIILMIVGGEARSRASSFVADQVPARMRPRATRIRVAQYQARNPMPKTQPLTPCSGAPGGRRGWSASRRRRRAGPGPRRVAR